MTFTPCSNAAGTHKLPLLVISKSANPRAFKVFNISVVCKATYKGWMPTSLFFDWFKNLFIPEVKGFLTQVNRALKVLLILDNARSHPKADEVNFDPSFVCIYFT